VGYLQVFKHACKVVWQFSAVNGTLAVIVESRARTRVETARQDRIMVINTIVLLFIL
jgi:hypothetical protein